MFVSANAPRVRPAAAAGRFYPGQRNLLHGEVMEHLEAAHPPAAEGVPKAIIAPHAGYPYSGPVAGSAFTPWNRAHPPLRRVILIGPSHFASFPGVAVSSARSFDAPTGEVPVDTDTVHQLLHKRLARLDDEAHQPEHALEVELPFLQAVLDDFTIVPLLVGEATGTEVAEVLHAVWGGPETGIVVSSDLSHYLDYESARSVDAETRVAIEALADGPMDAFHACGHLPIQGLLQVARARKLRPRTLDLRNSGDTAGSRDRVVGYGAWAFSCPEPEG